MAVGPGGRDSLPASFEWFRGGHPDPSEASVEAAERALALARSVDADEVLVILLSGGASAMLCAPAPGVTLADKQITSRLLMQAGADIHALNTVRKHLSAIKGGRLAASCRGATLAIAISDVVNDDFSAIGSGPATADPTSYGDALAILHGYRVYERIPTSVTQHLERGAAGAIEDTPKPGALALGRSLNVLAGGRRDAVEGARDEAAARGYDVAVLQDPVVGEARAAGKAHIDFVRAALLQLRRPSCILSGGETTVTVAGHGRGGRNQEWALAMAPAARELGSCAIASFGTDGVDGPTDAAGAFVDSTTLERARRAGLAPIESYLDNNDSYAVFKALGDLIVTGPTGTNVGDLQIVTVS